MSRAKITIDGNEAASRVAYQLNEVIAIYPITPSSPMGEWSDQWAAEKKPNLWGTVPCRLARWRRPLPPRRACC